MSLKQQTFVSTDMFFCLSLKSHLFHFLTFHSIFHLGHYEIWREFNVPTLTVVLETPRRRSETRHNLHDSSQCVSSRSAFKHFVAFQSFTSTLLWVLFDSIQFSSKCFKIKALLEDEEEFRNDPWIDENKKLKMWRQNKNLTEAVTEQKFNRLNSAEVPFSKRLTHSGIKPSKKRSYLVE